MSTITAVCCVHDDSVFLPYAVQALTPYVNVIVFVSKTDWTGGSGAWLNTVKLAREAGADVIVGSWPNEELHRQTSLTFLRDRGFRHAITFDSDEIFEPQLIQTLLSIHESKSADRVYATMNTYWKTPAYVISPRDPWEPLVMLDLQRSQHRHCRWYVGGRPVTLAESAGIFHHLSYAGPSDRIFRKVNTWGHRHEVIPGWFENVWERWDDQRTMENIHPTKPEHFRAAVPNDPVPCLRPIPSEGWIRTGS